MAEEIINRVANSQLKVIDLEEYYPEGDRVVLDIKDWLYHGLVLQEKEFRKQVNSHDWSQYQNKYMAIICSSNAIIPAWAFMLIAIELQSFATFSILGNLEQLEISLFQDIVNNLDLSSYKNKPVIIKGCSKKQIPESAYILISQKLKTVASSIMYGEACSSVPLFKR